MHHTVTRRAFTLVELLIVVTVLGIVMVALTKVIVGQQRFYRGASEMIETQDNVRDAVDLLRSELRGISPRSTDLNATGDITAMSRTSIRFFEPVASSVVCAIGANRTSVTSPPLRLASNTGLTSWSSTPKQGDSVLVFDPSQTTSMSDDRWDAFTLSAVPTAGATCPTTTGFTVGGEASKGYTFTLSGALPATVPSQGSPIRVFRQVQYRLYAADDGQWYLGYQECPDNACTTIQPVSGPYAGANGLAFTYYDATGAVTANPAAVVRIQVTARAATRSTDFIPGLQVARRVDSLTATIGVRN
jgi:prepilin-type N-terminal cleavage/methylation domain-containing protein